jgi:hypothetical protein
MMVAGPESVVEVVRSGQIWVDLEGRPAGLEEPGDVRFQKGVWR